MLYLDTSVVLALFVREPMSESIGKWIASRRQPLAFSDWGLTECASALGIRLRRGELGNDAATRALGAMTTFTNESCELIAGAGHHQKEAQRLLARFDLPLRSGDALHLAISQHVQATLVTCDKQLMAAAKAIGAKARDPLAL
ncbi:MAG: type II toxin-antitoxin system VapC family toxin [Sulfuritalea sp.]|nr:type II toxin-antitoxin system VapC family toxin [Sulfuritalea sp.]